MKKLLLILLFWSWAIAGFSATFNVTNTTSIHWANDGENATADVQTNSHSHTSANITDLGGTIDVNTNVTYGVIAYGWGNHASGTYALQSNLTTHNNTAIHLTNTTIAPEWGNIKNVTNGTQFTNLNYANLTGKPNQVLNTTSNVTFNSVTAQNYSGNWTGAKITTAYLDNASQYDEAYTNYFNKSSSYMANWNTSYNNYVNKTTQTKTVTIYNLTTAHDIPMGIIPMAVNVTRVDFVCVGGTNATVSLERAAQPADGNYSNATWAYILNNTVINGNTWTNVTAFNKTATLANDLWRLNTTTVNGVPTTFTGTVCYSE